MYNSTQLYSANTNNYKKSSELLQSLRWFHTDVSGVPIGPVFKGQALDSFTLEDGTDG